MIANCVAAGAHAAAVAVCLLMPMALVGCSPTETVGAAPASSIAPPPSTVATAPTGDCAAEKRQLDTMSANGQGHSAAYRTALDKYLSHCF